MAELFYSHTLCLIILCFWYRIYEISIKFIPKFNGEKKGITIEVEWERMGTWVYGLVQIQGEEIYAYAYNLYRQIVIELI